MADHIVGDVFARLLEQCAMDKGPTLSLRSYLYETADHLRETAAIPGKEVQYVKVIQNRALTKLRKVLEPGQLRKAVSLPGFQELSKALRV